MIMCLGGEVSRCSLCACAREGVGQGRHAWAFEVEESCKGERERV